MKKVCATSDLAYLQSTVNCTTGLIIGVVVGAVFEEQGGSGFCATLGRMDPVNFRP